MRGAEGAEPAGLPSGLGRLSRPGCSAASSGTTGLCSRARRPRQLSSRPLPASQPGLRCARSLPEALPAKTRPAASPTSSPGSQRGGQACVPLRDPPTRVLKRRPTGHGGAHRQPLSRAARGPARGAGRLPIRPPTGLVAPDAVCPVFTRRSGLATCISEGVRFLPSSPASEQEPRTRAALRARECSGFY